MTRVGKVNGDYVRENGVEEHREEINERQEIGEEIWKEVQRKKETIKELKTMARRK